MPLSILLPLVVFGIAGIVLAVHLTGNSAPRRFTDPADAMAAWNRAFPTRTARSARLSDDARAALIETDAGPGLCWGFGADTTAHPFTTRCEVRDTGNGLRIRFHDIAAPGLTVTLADPAARADWIATLKQEARAA